MKAKQLLSADNEIMVKPTNIDEYIATFPKEVQLILQEFREIVRATAPEAEELISYNVPAFRSGKMLVWFGAHSRHIGFYPRGSAIEAFEPELTVYETSKGTVKFPFDKPLPVELIIKMVKFRVVENMQRHSVGKSK